jgi:FkbH-like protein
MAIAASFTAEPLLPGLRLVLDEAGLALDVAFAPYGQVFQELLSPTSLLATNANGVNVVLVRIEDFVREVSGVEEARALAGRTLQELADALSQYSRRVRVPTVLAVLPPLPGATRAAVADLEVSCATLVAHARTVPGITLLSSEDIDRLSTGERYDSLSDELAHVPFTDEHYASIALAIVRKVHALRVPAHKVLVLDCDNTLWRGVVGEDGIDGITIPDSLMRLQQFAVGEQMRGTLLCLTSKNAEKDVLDVLEKRSDMVLKAEHVIAHRINWEPKPRNVAALARALNLGLDSFVFLDDNPIECAQMQAEMPQVVTLQIPTDDEIESFLSHLWTFDRLAVTDEDARRTRLYRENAARQELEESTTDIVEFIASLDLVIDIAPPEENEWPRAAQLTQRTNQFNFTTVRRTETETRALPVNGFTVLRVKVRDRFGDYGLVGLIVAHVRAGVLIVDTMLLSCRVLGRGVEHAMLRRLGELAQETALSHVYLSYVPAPKNEPAGAFAESVASAFRSPEHDGILYRIPVDEACAIAHRPGHDPAAVIEARKSEESKGIASRVSPSGRNRSERYAKLARELVSGRAVLDALRARGARTRTLPGQTEEPATETERKLLALWEEVLAIEGLGVGDNYFALGGTSLLAARLFADIERRFGVRLRLTVILESPTVRALAEEIDLRAQKRSGTLVELKRGGPRNLFLVHDGDGETLLYLNMARRMPINLGVFGIEPRRIPGVPLAHVRIEDMASFYIEQVRKKQPQGPYLLGGMCAGGVIAYEMASQLTTAGEGVELVVLLDAAAPQARKRAGRITKQRFGRLAQVFVQAGDAKGPVVDRVHSIMQAVLQKLLNAFRWEIVQRVRLLATRARFRLLRELLRRQQPWPPFVPPLSVRQIYDAAEAGYVPRPLSNSGAVLVRARAGEADDTPYVEIYADDTFGWGEAAGGLTVIDVNGGHSSMLQEPFADALAAALMPHVTSNPELRHVRVA